MSNSIWFSDISSEADSNQQQANKFPYFGIFTQHPARIGMSIPRPTTPCPSYFSDPKQNFHHNSNFESSIGFSFEVDLAACGKGKRHIQEAQINSFSPAPSFVSAEDGMSTESPFLSVF